MQARSTNTTTRRNRSSGHATQYSSGTPYLEALLADCAAAGFRPEFAVDGEDYATAQGFLAAGLEVTLIPRLALPGPHPGVVVRELSDPAPVRSIHTAYARRLSASPHSPPS
ncbi:hypothetical protein GCM10010404_88690 [Nonomuraea africana]|uniref:DNA-binding transcriptional LysR family regulator n=1 Tax=Nonomuraea africana TaxID=46171 RepID=A0ABR9KJH4_9ACTN|nr:LysR substrate-binding domain-containing protein [Nonomuraea africana]MBE1562173.1 DNA-binding transcriptional LysR family regulator [Nonomuraea africana]